MYTMTVVMHVMLSVRGAVVYTSDRHTGMQNVYGRFFTSSVFMCDRHRRCLSSVGRNIIIYICLLGAFCLGLFLVVNKNLHMFVCMLSSSFTTNIARQQCCCFISMISCYVVVLLLVVCFCFACIHCFPFIMLALFVFVCFAINAQF